MELTPKEELTLYITFAITLALGLWLGYGTYLGAQPV